MKAKPGPKPKEGLKHLEKAALHKAPTPPDDFTAEQKAAFRTYATDLVNRSILFDSDVPDLIRLVRLETQFDALLSELEVNGVLITDKNKDPRRNPALMALNNLSGIITALKKVLALNPYGRNKLPGNAPDKAKSVDGLYSTLLHSAYKRSGEKGVVEEARRLNMARDRVIAWWQENYDEFDINPLPYIT